MAAVLSALCDALIEVDREGRIWDLRASDESALFRPPEAVLGRPLREVYPPAVARAVMETIDRAVAAGRRTGSTCVLETGGETRWYELSVATVATQPAPGERLIVLARDITERKRAEQELEGARFVLRSALDGALDGIVSTDLDGVVIEFNLCAERLFGCRRQDALGKSVADFLVPPHRRLVRVEDRERLAGSGEAQTSSRTVEVTALRADGSEFPAELSLSAQAEAGRTILTASFRDLSERERAAEALRESEALFQDLVEASQDLIWRTDAEGRFTFLNRAWEKTHGYRVEEMLGRRFVEFQTPEVAARDTQEFQRHLTGGRASGYQTTHVSKTGETLHLVFNALPLRDSSGRIIGAQGTAYDVSERKRAQSGLRERERHLRLQSAALDAAANAIILTDREGRIEWVNSAFTLLTGFAASEVIGKTPRFLKSGVHDRAFYAQIWETLLAGRVWHGEIVNRRKDGRLYTEEMTVTPVPGEDGGVSHFVAIKQDVDRRKAAERRLAALHRVSSAALGSVSTREAYRAVVQVVAEAVGYPFVAIERYDRSRSKLVFEAGVGLDTGSEEGQLEVDLDETLSGVVVRSGEPFVTTDALERPEYRNEALRALRINTFVCVPMVVGGRVIGALSLGSRDRIGVDQGFVEWVCSLANHMALLAQRAWAEQELRASEERLRSVAENAPDYILMLDGRGTIQFVNRTVPEVSREALLGTSIQDWAPGDRREELAECLSRVVQSREPTRFELELSDASGAVRSYEARVGPIMRGGEVTAVVVVATDVTERVRADAAIRAAAGEWSRTFDAMHSALLVLDGEGRIVRLNAAARDAAGREYRLCLGKQVGELGRGEPWTTAAAMVGQWCAGEGAVPARVRDEASGVFWDISVSSAEIGPESSRRLILTLRDVSRLVALEESVRQTETMAAMGSLVAGVAHEVRNPLFAISVNVDALDVVLRERSDLKANLAALRSERDRLNELMVDLLEYGKPQSASLVEGDLDQVIIDAVRSCAEVAEQRGVAIAAPARRGGFRVMSDRSRLQQVFENLLDNACHHSPSGEQVRLEVEGFTQAGDAWVRCVVSDSGPGFPEDVLPQVFEPFFTRRRGGTGLGLSIVQRIVQQHGGRIFASNGKERGAVMTVELPCAPR